MLVAFRLVVPSADLLLVRSGLPVLLLNLGPDVAQGDSAVEHQALGR
jgi:hypothetical protein